jgi:cytochrome c oxidase assembly protein subunit 15
MKDMPARLRTLRWIALSCALVLLAVTSLSAFVRLSRGAAGCEPWPQCYTQRAASDPQPSSRNDTPAVTVARMAHRVVASTALLLVIALVFLSLAKQPPLRTQGRLSLALLVAALFLAILGRFAGDSRWAPVVLGNLLGGFAMVALAVRLALPPPGLPPKLAGWAAVAAGLAALQAALGSSIDATWQAASCTVADNCGVHRLGGFAVAAVVAPLGIAAWRAGSRLGIVAVALVAAQVALGLAMQASGLPVAQLVAHNTLAALLLATLVAMAGGPRGGAMR